MISWRSFSEFHMRFLSNLIKSAGDFQNERSSTELFGCIQVKKSGISWMLTSTGWLLWWSGSLRKQPTLPCFWLISRTCKFQIRTENGEDFSGFINPWYTPALCEGVVVIYNRYIKHVVMVATRIRSLGLLAVVAWLVFKECQWLVNRVVAPVVRDLPSLTLTASSPPENWWQRETIRLPFGLCSGAKC